MKCLNVRGLALTSSKAKVNIIEDSLEMDNSIGIFLTETWLDESIYDAEIQMNNINIPGLKKRLVCQDLLLILDEG